MGESALPILDSRITSDSLFHAYLKTYLKKSKLLFKE
jgi:hypothetical protein